MRVFASVLTHDAVLDGIARVLLLGFTIQVPVLVARGKKKIEGCYRITMVWGRKYDKLCSSDF